MKVLAKHFTHIDHIFNIKNKVNTTIIKKLGLIIVDNLINFFQDRKNIFLINNLIQQVNIIYLDSQQYPSILKDKKICLTGTLKKFSRTALIKKLEFLGASIVTSISKQTDILIYGKNPGNKMMKAQMLKVKLVHENEILNLTKHTIL